MITEKTALKNVSTESSNQKEFPNETIFPFGEDFPKSGSILRCEGISYWLKIGSEPF